MSQHDMLWGTKMLFLVAIVLVFRFQEILTVPNVPLDSVSNEDVKMTLITLKNYLVALNRAIDHIGDDMLEDNNLMEAIWNYEAISAYAKKTSCKTVEKKVRSKQKDVDKMKSFIDTCATVQRLDSLTAFSAKVNNAQAKAKAIDDVLKNNEETSDTDPTGYDERKKKALEDLSHILTDDIMTDFDNGFAMVLSEAREQVKKCFSEKSAQFQDEVEKSIKHITDCLDLLP